jgi:hypothetical protein
MMDTFGLRIRTLKHESWEVQAKENKTGAYRVAEQSLLVCIQSALTDGQ